MRWTTTHEWQSTADASAFQSEKLKRFAACAAALARYDMTVRCPIMISYGFEHLGDVCFVLYGAQIAFAGSVMKSFGSFDGAVR